MRTCRNGSDRRLFVGAGLMGGLEVCRTICRTVPRISHKSGASDSGGGRRRRGKSRNRYESPRFSTDSGRKRVMDLQVVLPADILDRSSAPDGAVATQMSKLPQPRKTELKQGRHSQRHWFEEIISHRRSALRSAGACRRLDSGHKGRVRCSLCLRF